MQDRTPFTYVIKNLDTGIRYYGCRYAEGCHPDDLWKSYFTSSKEIKRIIKESGKDNWSFEIRQIFNNIEMCKAWEEKVLRRLGVPKNSNWYNQSIGGKKFMLQGEALERQRRIVSQLMKEKALTPEFKLLRQTVNKIRWDQEGAREQHSIMMKEYWADIEWKQKIIKDRILRFANPELRAQMSDIMIEVWKRVEYQDKHKEAMKVVYTNPEWLENNRIKQTAAWKDPIKRENRLRNRKPHTEEIRQIQSTSSTESNKKSWADPIIREKRIAGIKAACAKRKAAKEAAFLETPKLN